VHPAGGIFQCERSAARHNRSRGPPAAGMKLRPQGSTKEAWIPAALATESALDCCRSGRIPI
jgi:hypothetical protein